MGRRAHLLRRALARAAAGAELEASTSADARRDVRGSRGVSGGGGAERGALRAGAQELGRNPQADLASGRLVILDALSRPYPPRASHGGDGDAAAVERRATPRDDHESPRNDSSAASSARSAYEPCDRPEPSTSTPSRPPPPTPAASSSSTSVAARRRRRASTPHRRLARRGRSPRLVRRPS